MATTTFNKLYCSKCNNKEDIYECKECLTTFCFNHLTIHRDINNGEIDEFKDEYNSFRQIFNEQKNDSQKRSLIKQINQWKNDSIQKIEQIAKECEQKLISYTNKFLSNIEDQLNKLNNQIKEINKTNKCYQNNLNKLKEKLNKLKEEIDQPTTVSIQQRPSTFINEIFVILPVQKETNKPFSTIHLETIWKQFGTTIAGGNGQGKELNQLDQPYGIFIDDDQTIYIADCYNHRIVEWKSNAVNGQLVAGGNGSGNQMNQLSYPTDIILDQETNSLIIADWGNRRVMRWSRQNKTNGEVIISNIDSARLTMDKYGSLYVSDFKKNEVRRWKREDKNGTLVTIGNRKDDQLNGPTFMFINEDDSLFVSDCDNHRVMKWLKDAKEGIVVAGGNGQGNSLTQLSYPEGVFVDQLGQIYVADSGNHRVMRWCSGAKEGTIVVGGNGKGQQSNQLTRPRGLSFDRKGNLYVAVHLNHRIQKFEVE